MTAFTKLEELRSTARARAQEDFEYFANTVCGLQLPQDVCASVQKSVELGVQPPTFVLPLQKLRQLERALQMWLVVLGRPAAQVQYVECETLSWLFPQRAA